MTLGCPGGQKWGLVGCPGSEMGIYWPDFCNSSPAWTAGNNRTAVARRLTANGAAFSRTEPRTVTSRVRLLPWTSYAANYTVSDTTSGRGIMILPPLVGGVPQSLNLVFYVVNAGKQFAMEVDPHSLQMERKYWREHWRERHRIRGFDFEVCGGLVE